MNRPPELRTEILSHYASARPNLDSEQRRNLREILRDSDNPARAYDWFIGLLSDEDLTNIEDYNASPSEQELLARQLDLIAELDTFVEDPLSVPAEKHPQLLRHLAYQMERSMPTLIDEPLKPGEHLVSISFNGVKALNQNGAGIHITSQILQRFRQEIDTALRQHDLIDITVLPTQQLWKRVSFRLPAGDITEITQKIEAMEAQVTSRIQAYIDTFTESDIPADLKEETKESIHLTSGVASATEQEMDVFDALHLSVMQCEAQAFYDDSQDKKELLHRLLNDSPDAQNILALLEREKPASHTEQLQQLFETSDELHHFIIQTAQRHAPTYLEEMPGVQDGIGISETFFAHIRQENLGAMLETFHGAPVTRGEVLALYHLGKLYTQTLFTPTVLKEFTHDQRTQHHRKTHALQSSAERVLALARTGTITSENVLTAKQHLAEAWDHLRRDHRFTDAGLEGIFMNPLFFDKTALQYDSPKYLSLDLIGVGAEYLREAQMTQRHIAQAGNTQESILAETRTLGESSWKRIKSTFDAVGESLLAEPTIEAYIAANNGLIPAFTKGDEMVIAIPGDVATEDIIHAMQRSYRALGTESSQNDARISLATATRADDPDQTQTDKIAAHLDTRVLSEKIGIDIAKKLEDIIPDGVIEIARDTHGKVIFRVHWGTEPTHASRWFEADALLIQNGDEETDDQQSQDMLDSIRKEVASHT